MISSSSLRFAFLTALLTVAACATARPANTARVQPTQAEQGRPLNDAELREHRAMQARMRNGYHAAFDQTSVIMIDIVEGSIATGAWYISYNLMEPRNGTEREPQLGGSECFISATSRPTCAIVIPPHYEGFYLYAASVDRGVSEPFTGRLRVRRGNGEVVEYRTGTFERPTGTSILAPSAVIDARPASGTTAAR